MGPESLWPGEQRLVPWAAWELLGHAAHGTEALEQVAFPGILHWLIGLLVME